MITFVRRPDPSGPSGPRRGLAAPVTPGAQGIGLYLDDLSDGIWGPSGRPAQRDLEATLDDLDERDLGKE